MLLTAPPHLARDYQVFCSERFEFLRFDKPENLDDLLWGLAALYDNVLLSPAALSMLVSWTRLLIRSGGHD